MFHRIKKKRSFRKSSRRAGLILFAWLPSLLSSWKRSVLHTTRAKKSAPTRMGRFKPALLNFWQSFSAFARVSSSAIILLVFLVSSSSLGNLQAMTGQPEHRSSSENQRRMIPSSTSVIWQPQAGSQELFLSCPIFECLYEGTRGPGKTDALLMDYAQDVGKGYGASWSGVLFRREYKELADVVKKSKKWFPRIFPDARFLESQSEFKWRWKTGEELLFRTVKRPADYWNYHGHEYPWIGWEELTNWPDSELYLDMMSVCRSSDPRVPRKYRGTANPYGAGHNWVKSRFIDPAPRV